MMVKIPVFRFSRFPEVPVNLNQQDSQSSDPGYCGGGELPSALHTLVQLQCGDGGGQGKKLFKSGIPTRKKK